MITLLIVTAVLLFRVCITAALSGCMREHAGTGAGLRWRGLDDPAGSGWSLGGWPVVPMTNAGRAAMAVSVPAQDCVTRDDVRVQIEAVVYLRPVDGRPVRLDADECELSRLVQTSLRTVVGGSDLDALFASAGQPTGSVGPQDAPLGTPWPPARGPQDAVAPRATGAVPPEASTSAPAVVGSSGTTTALRERPARRSLPSVKRILEGGRAPASDVRQQRAATTETSVVDSIPRPLGGPAYLGGREDTAYLRGWDDAVDWVRRGNEEQPPSWGSAAYMTGWNDAVRAVAKARRRGSPEA